MKKIIALLLALCLVASIGTAALAAPSVHKEEPSFPKIPEGAGIEIRFMIDDAVDYVIPTENVIFVSLYDADSLEGSDKEAFLAAYEDVKAIKDQVVKYFFWLDVTDEYQEIPEDEYASFRFICTGKNVKVLVNGEEAEVEALEEENSYLAKLPSFGAVAILCDAE